MVREDLIDSCGVSDVSLEKFVAITKPPATTTSITKLSAHTLRFITLLCLTCFGGTFLLPNLEVAEKCGSAKSPVRRPLSAMLGKIGPRIIVPSSTTVNSCCQPRSCLVNGSDAWQRRGRAHSSREADKREVPSTSCEDWRRKKCTIDSAPGLALVTNGVKYYAISVKTTVFRATQNSPLT